MTTPDIFYPNFDLGEFRYAAARYVKLLIRARWRCHPNFLGQEHLAAWGLEDIAHERWPAWKLLDQAGLALGHLNQHFLPRCGSGGVRETDESTPEGRLIFAVALLAVMDGSGLRHNGALFNAAHHLREGKAVSWDELVDWNLLDAIRADLNQLPHPRCADPSPRLERIEELLSSLIDREQIKDWYGIEEFARLVGKAEFTCREWCRLGRIRALKKASGRGRYRSWAISHDELLRYRKEGLLPLSR